MKFPNELRKALIIALGGYTERVHPPVSKFVAVKAERKPVCLRVTVNQKHTSGMHGNVWISSKEVEVLARAKLARKLTDLLLSQADLYTMQRDLAQDQYTMTVCIIPPVSPLDVEEDGDA